MKEPQCKKAGVYNRWTPPDLEWLEYQYGTLNKSGNTIAEEVGCDTSTVMQWRNLLGIPVSTGKELASKKQSTRRKNLPYTHTAPGQKRDMDRWGFERICKWCGTTKNIQLHHKNHNPRDGRPKNMVWLCKNCHLLETRMWQIRKAGKAKVSVSNKIITIDFNV